MENIHIESFCLYKSKVVSLLKRNSWLYPQRKEHGLLSKHFTMFYLVGQRSSSPKKLSRQPHKPRPPYVLHKLQSIEQIDLGKAPLVDLVIPTLSVANQ